MTFSSFNCRRRFRNVSHIMSNAFREKRCAYGYNVSSGAVSNGLGV